MVLLLFLLPHPTRAAITVCDDTGWEVTLEKPATRIIALYGAFNELLLAMGLDATIIARTKADAAIPALRHLPEVGTHMRPNPELIVALAPHIVIQMEGRQEADVISQTLRRMGIPVLMFKMGNFDEIFAVLQRLGVLTHEEERADQLTQQWKKRLNTIATALLNTPRKRVIYEVRYPNLLAAGQDSIVNDIILHAGGRNVITTPGRVVRLNEEELIRHDPDAYLIQQGPMNPAPTPLESRKHYESLRALREGTSLVVDEHAFARPGPRAIEAVEILAKWLHPTVDFTLPQ
ncbi:MAG: helical backbone metal receptor [Desulfovibrionaceae bacterium]